MTWVCKFTPPAVLNACECPWGPVTSDAPPMRMHVETCPRRLPPRCLHRACDPDYVPDVPEWPAPGCAICNSQVENLSVRPRWCRLCWSTYQRERRAFKTQGLPMDRDFVRKRRNALARMTKPSLPPSAAMRSYLAARCGLCGTEYPMKKNGAKTTAIGSRISPLHLGELTALFGKNRPCATCSYAIKTAFTKVPDHVVARRREEVIAYQDTVRDIREALGILKVPVMIMFPRKDP